MAKTSGGGGSLFGRADSTLVAAAFKEGQSRIGADLGEIYEKREESLKTFGEGIKAAFDNIFAEREADEKEMQTDIKQFNPNNPFDAMQSAHIDTVNWQKNELKKINETYKKGTPEYQKAISKFHASKAAYAKNVQAWSAITDDINDKGANNQIFGYDAGSPLQKLLNAIIKDANNNTAITNPMNDPDRNDIVFTLPGSDQEMIDDPKNPGTKIKNPNYKKGGVKMTLSELYKNLHTRDNTAPVAVSTALIDMTKFGKTSNVPKETRVNELYSNMMENMLVNKNDIVNVARKKDLPGMNGFSVEDYLTGNVPNKFGNPLVTEMYDILKGMHLDFDGSGTIDAADKTFVSSMNGVELATNIMKDESIYKQVTAKVISEQAGGEAFDQGGLDKPEQKGKEGSYTMAQFMRAGWHTAGIHGNVSATAIKGDADKFKEITEAGGNEEWYEALINTDSKYKLEKGQWWVKRWNRKKGSEGKWLPKEKLSPQGVKNDMGISGFDYLFFPESVKDETTKETQEIDDKGRDKDGVIVQKNKQKNASDNPITDYEKRGGKWYYIKDGKNKPVDKSNYKRLEKKLQEQQDTTKELDIISGLGGITEEKMEGGKLIKYYNYIGNDYNAAAEALATAEDAGIEDGFIRFLDKSGKEITINDYRKLKDKSNITFKVQLGVGRKSIAQKDVEVPETSVTPSDTTITPSDTTITTPSDTTITEPSVVEDVEDQDYGSDNPHPMRGMTNTSKDEMIDRYGNYVKIGGKAYFDDLGINDEELMGELISDEGFVEDGLPYKDTGGTTTIGFGYTKWSLDGKDGRPHWSEYWDKTGKSTGKTMSKEEAEMLMPKVTKIYVDQAKKVIKNKNITPKQFNAIVNLIYRNGIGNVKKSGVIKAINKGDIEEVRRIISENPHLRKSGGKVLEEGDEGYKGITNRNASIADSLIVQTI